MPTPLRHAAPAAVRFIPALLCLCAPGPAAAIEFMGVQADYKLTVGYAAAMRVEAQNPQLTNGPIDVQQVSLNFDPSSCAVPPCIGSFGHTGLPTTTNFDDNNRDFKRGALLNNRVSGYGELHLDFSGFGLGNVGGVASGAAHYDRVFWEGNDHDNPDSANRQALDSNSDRTGPIDQWSQGARDQNGRRIRWLEGYLYGEWNLQEDMALALRYGRHLAAWGESLFFPGIASAQGPFDASKANVPGAEVKEILLPVRQASMQLALTSYLTLLAYKQFEFKPTELFPEGDFFSPADLVGPGAVFGFGAINPLNARWCGDPSRVHVTDAATGATLPPGSLCTVGAATSNEPVYIMTPRTPDKIPTNRQWGTGLKFQATSDLNVGLYYIKYNNHNPQALLNMGSARVGDLPGGQPLTTADLGLSIPESYTIAYADNITMKALSFSTVLWVFNVGGEVTYRQNVDMSLEANILGVPSPVATRGSTTTAQTSLLYVNNPGFVYDEVVFVGEFAFTQVNHVDPRRNIPGICYKGTDPNDCNNATPVEEGHELFYSRKAWGLQTLLSPKARNAVPGWDIGTPVNFAWLVKGTPSTPGVLGSLYGEGDVRLGVGLEAQYLQNLDFLLSYNAFFGSAARLIGDSPLHANPYVDHDYVAFSAKYSL